MVDQVYTCCKMTQESALILVALLQDSKGLEVSTSRNRKCHSDFYGLLGFNRKATG